MLLVSCNYLGLRDLKVFSDKKICMEEKGELYF